MIPLHKTKVPRFDHGPKEPPPDLTVSGNLGKFKFMEKQKNEHFRGSSRFGIFDHLQDTILSQDVKVFIDGVD